MPYHQGHGIGQKQQQSQRHYPEWVQIKISELKEAGKYLPKHVNRNAVTVEQRNTQMGTLQKCFSFVKIASARY